MVAAQVQSLYELYRQQAAAQGDAVAVQGLNAADLSYKGFIAQTERVIEALTAWGVGRGDRVMVQVPNGPEAFVIMHGVGAMAVAVLADPRAGAAEMEYFLKFTEPKALILQQGLESSGRTLAPKYGVPVVDIIPTPDSGAGTFVFADSPPALTVTPSLNGPDDLSFLIFTSGTTALPKMVPRTQNGMLRAIRVPLLIQFRATGETMPMRAINYLPMHLLYGCIVPSAALASGGSVACLPGLEPDRFYYWLDLYRPVFLAGPPPVLEQFLATASQHEDVLSRHNIRYINTGSTALSEATRAELNRLFNVPIVQTYGMTELEIISQLILPAGSTDVVTNIGRAEYVDRTGIMASDGSLLPAGQAGEIVVRSETFTGYWNNPEANDDSFVDGWFRTGDEGVMDEDGNITLVGRIKEVINSGGAKVSPYEVEAVLLQHPLVEQVAVFGLRNSEVGETVAAAVVGTVSERDLRRFAAEQLPFYKVPMRIISVDAIPKTAYGKVQRNRLAVLLGLK